MKRTRPTATGAPVRIALGILAATLLGPLPAAAQEADVPTAADAAARSAYPILRIPYMPKPPKIDGNMDPGEWADAAAYSGFWQDYSHNTFIYLAIKEKQPTFWVAYDKDNIYFAHRSDVFPRAAWLLARGKYKDVISHPKYGVLWDDHIEFQIMPETGDKRGFFKWMSNPIDTQVDYFRPWTMTADDEREYDSGYDLKGNWDEDQWVTEMRIPLKSLAYGPHAGNDDSGRPRVPVPIPDGTIWRHWGSRAIGGTGGYTRLFSATTPGGWTSMTQRWIFDSKGVGAQVIQFGKLFRDKIDLDIQLKNHGDRTETVRVGFYIENDEELIVSNAAEEFVELLPGAVKRIRIQKDAIGITSTGNAVWCDIRTNSGKQVYRSIVIPFHSETGLPGFKEHFIDGMKYSRPDKQPFGYNYIYYPDKNVVWAEVDTDVFGIDPKARTAVKAKVTLMTEEGKAVGEMAFDLAKPLASPDAKYFGGRNGKGTLSFEKLAPGNYKTRCLLYDADNRIVGDRETKTFEQRSFPWENSTEGAEDLCWKPYVPMKWQSEPKTLDTLMQQITLSDSGLPAQVSIKGGKPWYGPQLRGPMRLEATAGGKRFTYKAGNPVKQTRDGKSEMSFESAGAVGPVKVRGRAHYECDGYLRYDLWYDTGDKPIDTLELVFELKGPVDFLVNYGGDHLQRVWGQEVLDRPGPVIWNSRDDTKPKELYYGNFNPYIVLGNGDRAFIWTCETDKGMKLLAENAAMQVEKTPQGEYTLRVFFVNEPGAVGQEKHVAFGLTSLPTRPKRENRRYENWHYEGLGGGPRLQDGAVYSIHMNRDEDYAKFQPKPITARPYTTANVVCWDMPALKHGTYAGEFTGSSLAGPNPDFRMAGEVNPITKRKADTIFLTAVTGWRWSPQQVNCAVYWRSKQIRLGGIQGFWWDHSFYAHRDIDTVIGNAYELPAGKFHAGGHQQDGFQFFYPREFFKRIARVSTKAGREITHAHYGGFDSALNAPFQRDQVHWEHSASYSGLFAHSEAWRLVEMRYYACNYTGLNGYIIHDVNYGLFSRKGGVDPQFDRSVIGNALLHDVGDARGRHANKYVYDRIVKALEDFGLFQPGDAVQYIPYWRSKGLYEFGIGVVGSDDEFAGEEDKERAEALKKVYCSVYRNTKSKEALLVLYNYSGKPVQENLRIPDELLGHTVKGFEDVEVGEPIDFMPDWKNNKEIPGLSRPLFIDKYQFRLIRVK